MIGIFVNRAPAAAAPRGVTVLLEYDDESAAASSLAALQADPRVAQLNSLPSPLTRDIVVGAERAMLEPADFAPTVPVQLRIDRSLAP